MRLRLKTETLFMIYLKINNNNQKLMTSRGIKVNLNV